MEENLLKYFFNDYLTTYQNIKPINIETGTYEGLQQMLFPLSMVTNDGSYFIRYGGVGRDGYYNAIEVYNNDSIKSGQPLLTFSNLSIYGHTFSIDDMKQDEDGRFYAIGQYEDTNTEYYLILFNNFIQDGYCQIRKFYTAANMGITDSDLVLLNVVKKKESSDYYMLSGNQKKIYHFKIDIMQGNSLETYNYTVSSSIQNGSSEDQLHMIGDILIKTSIIQDNSGNSSCTKLTIDTSEELKNSYAETEVYYLASGGNELISVGMNNFKYYIGYFEPISGGALLVFEVIDLNGNVKALVPPGSYDWSQRAYVSFTDNYITFKQGDTLKLFYYDYDSTEIIEFYNNTFSGIFTQIQVLKQFDLVNLVGLNSRTSLAYSMNVYSVGYSSEPYINTNFLIPQYLNLYSANDSLIYSRDVVNRFLAGNQLTTTFNVPNYLLNNTEIKREAVYGQTNLPITDNVKTYTKNRFESLYLTYIYGIQIIDNTNGNNLLNTTGSNRLANSVWNLRDSDRVPCLKARITHEDGSQSILSLDTTNISDNTCTIEFEVTGNIQKIEYLSNDEQTVYATYRCSLTGTNTITQIIEIS